MTRQTRSPVWLIFGLLLCTLLAGCASEAAKKPSTAVKATATPTVTASPSSTLEPSSTTLYFAVGQKVYAFDAHTGAKRWTFDTGVGQGQYGVQPIGALAATPGALVFIDPANRTVYALSVVDGSLKWKSDANQAMDELVMAPGVVIASSGCLQCPNTTSAFDLSTGKSLWTQPMGGTSWAVGDGVVYKARILPSGDAAPITNGTLQALNPATGAVIWQGTGHAFNGLTLIGSTLYSMADDAVHAFDAKTGAEIWTHALNPTSGYPWLTGQGNELYFGDQTTMYALDGATHTLRWHAPLTGLCTGITNGTIACDVPTGQPGASDVTGRDTMSGSVLWQATDLGANIPWGAKADNGLFLISGVHGATLGALDAQKGSVRWTMKASGPTNGMLTHDGVVYVAVIPSGGGADMLYAVSEMDGSTLWSFQAGANGNSLLAVG